MRIITFLGLELCSTRYRHASCWNSRKYAAHMQVVTLVGMQERRRRREADEHCRYPQQGHGGKCQSGQKCCQLACGIMHICPYNNPLRVKLHMHHTLADMHMLQPTHAGAFVASNGHI